MAPKITPRFCPNLRVAYRRGRRAAMREGRRALVFEGRGDLEPALEGTACWAWFENFTNGQRNFFTPVVDITPDGEAEIMWNDKPRDWEEPNPPDDGKPRLRVVTPT